MRKLLLVLALAAAAMAVHDVPARAQTADALGLPRPMDTLDEGTMTVRVVAGEMSSPIVGAEVRLAVNGEVRKAVTNAEGRATFQGLAPGAMVKASADGEAGEIASSTFPVPEGNGVAVLLSTVEWKGASAAPMAGQNRPNPRSMTGKPRAEKADPAGQVTVRVAYDDWDVTAGTAGVPVVMVAYSSDDRIGAQVVQTDVGGRAVFTGLDHTGNTAYYAMALLPRDGKVDRLMSAPILPFDDFGVRLMLSGEKLESGLPPVEDLEKSVPQADLQPGQVAVAFGGAPEKGSTIELRDVLTNKVVSTAKTAPARPLPSSVEARLSPAAPDAKLAAGTISIQAAFVMDKRAAGLPGVKVTVRALTVAPEPPKVKDAEQAPAPDPKAPAKDLPDPADQPRLGSFTGTGESDDDGNVTITGAPAGIWLEAVAEVEGKTFVGAPFSLKDAGVQIQVAATWQTRGLYEAIFEHVPATPRGAYLVEAKMRGETYRSPPFMTTEGRGVAVPIYAFPRVAVTFQLDATVEDDFLAAHGTFVVQNFSFAPYAGPAEGVKIPAPVGATGLVVGEQDKMWVSADAHEFRLLRPVPPFGATFRAAFSIKVEDGEVNWDMALPYGSFQSSLAILQTPHMKVTGLPAKSKTQVVPQPNGTQWFAIQDVFIAKDRRMMFHVTGLPQPPGWQRIARITAGIAVLLVMIAGVLFTVRKQVPVVAAAGAATNKQRKKRIDDLLEQVAVLDRAKAGKDDGRRDALVKELETLYGEDERP